MAEPASAVPKTLTDAQRTDLLRQARRVMWDPAHTNWNAELLSGMSRVVMHCDDLLRGFSPVFRRAFSHWRGELVVLSDPTLWAIHSFLSGSLPLEGVPRITEPSQIPIPVGTAPHQGVVMTHPSASILARLHDNSSRTPYAMEDLVLDNLACVLIDLDPDFEDENEPTDNDRASSSMDWELSLFSTPMLRRISRRILQLRARGQEEEAVKHPMFIVRPEGREDGEDEDEDEDLEWDMNDALYMNDLEQLDRIIRHELVVRGEFHDYAALRVSDAASVIQHRLGGSRGDNRQGLDLQRLVSSHVSGAISQITPIPTRPISHAQRLVEIQRMAARDAAEAEANPAVAARNLRRLSEAIKGLTESMDSNKRQRRDY